MRRPFRGEYYFVANITWLDSFLWDCVTKNCYASGITREEFGRPYVQGLPLNDTFHITS